MNTVTERDGAINPIHPESKPTIVTNNVSQPLNSFDLIDVEGHRFHIPLGNEPMPYFDIFNEEPIIKDETECYPEPVPFPTYDLNTPNISCVENQDPNDCSSCSRVVQLPHIYSMLLSYTKWTKY